MAAVLQLESAWGAYEKCRFLRTHPSYCDSQRSRTSWDSESLWYGKSYRTIPISLSQGTKSIREGDRSNKWMVMLFTEIKPKELGFFVL